MQYVHTRNTGAVTADNLPTVLPDAHLSPRHLMGSIMITVPGVGGLPATVRQVVGHGTIEHLLQPLRVKVGKGFQIPSIVN